MARSRGNRKIVPESAEVLRQWKYEIAAEFGLPVGYGAGTTGSSDTEFAGELGAVNGFASHTSSWGHLTSRENGSIGGEITKRLIAQAEKNLFI